MANEYPPLNPVVEDMHLRLDRFPLNVAEVAEVISLCKEGNCREASGAGGRWLHRLLIDGAKMKLDYHTINAKSNAARLAYERTPR